MKIDRSLSIIVIVMMIFLNVGIKQAAAEIVMVKGYGIDEAAAINDAKRNAVEKVVGTLLQSISRMEDLELVMDVVETRTQGYVNAFEIVNKSRDGDNVSIQARVGVSDEPNSSLMKDVELVMLLHDPSIAVKIEHYGDDEGETYKKYPAMTEAAIREELIKCGFTHVMDKATDVHYVIFGNLSVDKAKSVVLPKWSSIADDDFKTLNTGFVKTTATLDCKIKNLQTDEIIGEFNVSGESIDSEGNNVQNQAVTKMASKAAQEVKKLLDREASKVFYGETSNL